MSKQTTHVAAAVIYQGDKILIAKRPDHLHQGGLWEFPGGKVEMDESVQDALVRELDEELDIEATHYRPLIRIPHDYGDKQVLLDVWQVMAFEGEAHGREGQEIRWVEKEELSAYAFPAANRPILKAIMLPELCLVTPEPGDRDYFLNALERSLQQGIRLVQLRAKALNDSEYLQLASEAARICSTYTAQLLLNTSIEVFNKTGAAGLHLSAKRLMGLEMRPVDENTLLSAACHNEEELAQANRIGVDLIFVSPIKATASHPEAEAIGWEGLWRLTEHATMPVYALGGMDSDDLDEAQRNGAQGIAAIRALWQEQAC